MLSVDFLRDLYRHLEWADAHVWDAIETLDTKDSDEYLHNTIYHLHATQRAFMDFWSGKDLERSDPSQFETLEKIRDWSRSFYMEAGVLLTSLEEADLHQPAVVPWARYFVRHTGKEAVPTTLGETLYHLVIHSAYHRGQVNRRLRELGGEPPLVDYIAWLWLGRPSLE